MKVLLISLGLLFSVSGYAADKGEAKYKALCTACHGVDGKTTNAPFTPKLAGQNAAYLEKQLKDFTNNTRGNNQTMTAFAGMLTDEEKKQVSKYLSELK